MWQKCIFNYEIYTKKANMKKERSLFWNLFAFIFVPIFEKIFFKIFKKNFFFEKNFLKIFWIFFYWKVLTCSMSCALELARHSKWRHDHVINTQLTVTNILFIILLFKKGPFFQKTPKKALFFQKKPFFSKKRLKKALFSKKTLKKP